MHTVETLGPLTPAALAMLDTLVVQSGWNQTAADWNLFSRDGSICAVRDAQGQIVASGAVLPMGDTLPCQADQACPAGVAWISMILVAPALRGQGLGRRVFEHCLRQVQGTGRIAMLDATPQGEQLYSQFGFEPLWRLTRWRREARPATAPGLSSDKPALPPLVAMDAQALGFSRPALLGDLLGRADARYVRSALSFAIVRAGRTAQHIGPLLATEGTAAAALLLQAVRSLDGPLLVDALDERTLLRQALADAGFAPQRGFVRMALAAPGQPLPQGQTSFIHAIAGPEFA